MRILLLFFFLLAFLSKVDSQNTVGFISQTENSTEGYLLFSPIQSTKTYLIDKCGYEVHTWTSDYKPGQSVYLLENGSLLRTGNVGNSTFMAGGTGGIIEMFDWDNNLIWSYLFSDEIQCQHHDVCLLPNGNILVLSWELKMPDEATQAGRNPNLLGTVLWSEKIVELQPIGMSDANIVWEWHVWDHVVQEFDATKNNFEVVSEHPELIHLNYTTGLATSADWLHCNSISYNEDRDEVMLSSHNFSEIWIIDHSTTSAEASTHSGGDHNRGGDLLYRWGNPATYNRGGAIDKKFFGQHNAHWIKSGLPDEGKIMVFNNGLGRPEGNFSTVEILNPVVTSENNYLINSGESFLPANTEWIYTSETPTDFFSTNISGAHRLSSGNTMICEGITGRFFEIDNENNIAWTYINPVGMNGAVSQGQDPIQNATFRCTLYEMNYAGFSGQELIPTFPLENNPLPYDCGLISDIETPSSEITLKVVNPFSNRLLIFSGSSHQQSSWTLTDMNGKSIQNWSSVSLIRNTMTELAIDPFLPSGIYFLHSDLNEFASPVHFKLVH